MKKGFTLIELLVVVLIIGILAAVALPQYTKAVEKSRTAEAMQMLGDIATAESIYYMANNKFTGDLNKLDIVMAGVTAASSNVATNSYEISITSPGDKAEGDSTTSFTAVAERKAGTYAGDQMQITVAPSGAVTKCFPSANTKGLKDLATTWGGVCS